LEVAEEKSRNDFGCGLVVTVVGWDNNDWELTTAAKEVRGKADERSLFDDTRVTSREYEIIDRYMVITSTDGQEPVGGGVLQKRMD
jgi:hypothetical protein